MTGLSLRWRLVTAGAAAVVIALGLAAAGLTALFAGHVERRALAELQVHLDQVIAGLATDPSGALRQATPPADPRFRRPYGGLYWQIAAGDRLLRSRSLWDVRLDLPADELADQAAHAHRIAGPDGAELLTLERSVALPARLGGGTARAAVAMDAAELRAARNAFLADMAPYLGLLALALILAGWAQVGVGLRPLDRIGARIAAIRSGRTERVGDDWPVEVRPLAVELDALLAAREADIARARARAGDLAHGLKTPLQALLGEARRLAEAGQDRRAEGIEAIARAMQRHVDRELARARLAAKAAGARSDAAEVCRRVIAVVRRTPDGEALTWHCAAPDDGAPAAIDAADLAEALGALAENAARHAVAGVTVTVEAMDDTVAVTVADDGPGIAGDRLATITGRGVRLDQSGDGLGLAIASDIAEAAGGALALENRSPGLAARLTLPAAR
ncbi:MULTISPECIES: HAMP domain-containing sensor histidine kinase [unclassified Roseitalea]|uniref:sensor histidine kinase n=1 Tax=unclassified Roseitalea TaxID=2639107 RepID=UPI00273E50D9|nr:MULTISPECIES: HAMP domain-containing sensor histidine kinase [unclassified Roseitalea]